MAVDGEHQIIVATQVGLQASDQGQLVGLLDAFGVEPAVVLADAGYCNEPDLGAGEPRHDHVALGREGKMGGGRARPGSLPRTAWVRSWRASRARPGTRNASGSRRRRTGGSRKCSDSRYTLRGLAKVRGKWDLVCLALNIKRMGTLATC